MTSCRPSAEGQTSEPRLVVVDDDAGLLRTLQILLEDGGFRVVACRSGDEALARLAGDGGTERGADADLVLTDLAMPGRDGLDLTREVVRRFPGLPVLLMTAYPEALRVDEALALGARGLVVKPFDPERLLKALRLALVPPGVVPPGVVPPGVVSPGVVASGIVSPGEGGPSPAARPAPTPDGARKAGPVSAR